VTFRFITEGAEETVKAGARFASTLEAGDIVGLCGELGTGKTCFTKGMAQGLGVPARYLVTSPSFVVMNEYPGRVPLYHFDVYRLTGAADLIAMGYEDYFYGRGVTVIEWADKIRELIPPHAFMVFLSYVDVDRREVEISGSDARIQHIGKVMREGGWLWRS